MTDEDPFVTASKYARLPVETWQEEMARWKRDPESLRQRKADGLAVAELLRQRGVDLPIVLPNPHFPVGDQIGREARFAKEDGTPNVIDIDMVDFE